MDGRYTNVLEPVFGFILVTKLRTDRGAMVERSYLNSTTTRYRFGSPFETGAVVAHVAPGSPITTDDVARVSVSQSKNSLRLRLTLAPDDRVFGLGQMLGGLNKRGKRYRLFAKDDPSHTPDKSSLYGSHPFLIIQGASTLGVFVDFPGEIIFDVGFEDKNILEISLPRPDADVYLFSDWDMRKIVREYLLLTGTPYLPPRWSFGFQQCRYSYPDAASVRDVAKKFRELRIPCDAIYMDIDYMQSYKIFTVDDQTFPEFPAFVQEIQEQGFHLIPIIDPGVKVEPGYSAYDSGLSAQAFCTTADGEPFVATVWPGFVHFPDFLNQRARQWWGKLYSPFVSVGIKHFWNDMNEPAIFYTPESLKKLRTSVKQIEHNDDLGTKAVDFISSLGAFWQSEDDLSRFYHQLDDGTRVNHRDVHNLYGYSMALATADGLRELAPDQRYFLVTRSSYSGMHRFAVIWTGDNSSWWEHMLVQIRMMLALNFCGFFFCGGDVGGFIGDSSAELCTRWTQLGCFSPLFRNHSTKGSRHQEPWAFDPESTAIMRDTIRLRYALLPYTYSEYLSALDSLMPFVAPLFLHFGDEKLKDIEDQYMWGHSLMVAPVISSGARSRFVYLPECKWLHWNARRWDEHAVTITPPGPHLIEAPLESVPVFLRENALIVLTEPGEYVDQAPSSEFVIIGLVSSKAEFTVRHDDGVSWNFQNGEISTMRITVERTGDSYRTAVQCKSFPSCPIAITNLVFKIWDESGTLHRFTHQVSPS